MDKLIQIVSQKAGIGEDQARTAVETVVKFLKDRLPGPLAGQLDSALSDSGQGGEQSKSGSLGSKIPGL